MRRRKTLRAERRKSKFRNKLAYGITAVCVVLICLVAFSLHTKNSSPDDQSSPKAALIDHLSFSSPPPNETFKTQCRAILEYAGFDFTYHRGEQVTVDFYKNLPTYDYGLMILRVHSAVIKQSQGNLTNLIGLFTSEVYNETTVNQQYLSDLHEGRLALARLFKDQDTYYFGITPFFVQSNMMGNFKNTVIIMMGCEGLNHTSMAEALVQKGAEVYISWTCPVTISHTDDATIRLLQSLLQQNQTIKTAVELINPDPQYKGKLDYYPREVGDNSIQDFVA
ncbi:MAG: hypothetical protein OEX09_04405, partial [Candidatus Bathyarchaeota archaeon]|nr:hypothetical protein [Candidatus Bathyarchaeota archaeon]